MNGLRGGAAAAAVGLFCVFLGACGGGGSSTSTSTGTKLAPNPVPSLSSLSPSSARAGSAAFTLTVKGTGFVSNSTVDWNGAPRTTSYVSSSELTASITAADVANAGTNAVTVVSPSPGGGTSNSLTFAVSNTQPVINSIAPADATVGGPAFTLTVNGSGFGSTSQVQWDGAARPTNFVSPTKLTAQIGAADVSAAGVATVTVASQPPSGTSSPATFIVKLVSSDATEFQINPGHSGVMYFNPVTFPTQSTWSANVGGQPSYALIADGKVFVTVDLGGSSQLLALDQNTGAVLWGPIALSGVAAAAYDAGSVYVLNGVTGNPAIMGAYTSSTGTSQWNTVLSSQYAFSSGPTALNGFVYTGGAGTGGTLYALAEAGGAIAWTQTVANGDDSTPAVTASGVYVVYPCQTYDFVSNTGAPVWHNAAGCEGGGGATPVVAYGSLYAPNSSGGTYDGVVFAANTGTVLGSYAADNPPAIAKSDGYFLQSGTLRAIDRSTNTVRWSFAGDGTLDTSPIVVNQYVIVGASSGNLYAVDRSTGKQVWKVNVGAAIPAGAGWGKSIPLSGLAAGHGLLIVPAGNSVIAYRLASD